VKTFSLGIEGGTMVVKIGVVLAIGILVNLALNIGIIMYLRGYYRWITFEIDRGRLKMWYWKSPYSAENILSGGWYERFL
jgi:hypothetical protein